MNEELMTVYAAGLFDGEGSFSIQVNIRQTKRGVSNVHFIPKISMTLRYGAEVLDELVELFGGNIYDYKDGSRRWSMGRREEMMAAAEKLRPYLKIKANICDQFLEALSLFPESSLGVNRWAGERSWSEEATLRVAEIALTMNPQSSRKTEKKIDYLDNIRSMYVDAIIKEKNDD